MTIKKHEYPLKSMATRSRKRYTSVQSDLRWKKVGQIGVGQAFIVEVGRDKSRILLFSLTDLSTGEIYSLGGDEEGDPSSMDSQN
jgi:hypothetical protein